MYQKKIMSKLIFPHVNYLKSSDFYVFSKYLEILSRKFYLNKWLRIGKENWELRFGGFGKKLVT